MSKLNQISSFDAVTGVVMCQAGVVLEKLEQYLNDKGFVVPLDLGAKGRYANYTWVLEITRVVYFWLILCFFLILFDSFLCHHLFVLFRCFFGRKLSRRRNECSI